VSALDNRQTFFYRAGGSVNGTDGAMFKAWFREDKERNALLIK
jgi:hypothetical protein